MSNSVTRQVSFNRSKIGGKCQNSNATFWVFFKQCGFSLVLNLANFFDEKYKDARESFKGWFGLTSSAFWIADFVPSKMKQWYFDKHMVHIYTFDTKLLLFLWYCSSWNSSSRATCSPKCGRILRHKTHLGRLPWPPRRSRQTTELANTGNVRTTMTGRRAFIHRWSK